MFPQVGFYPEQKSIKHSFACALLGSERTQTHFLPRQLVAPDTLLKVYLIRGSWPLTPIIAGEAKEPTLPLSSRSCIDKVWGCLSTCQRTTFLKQLKSFAYFPSSFCVCPRDKHAAIDFFPFCVNGSRFAVISSFSRPSPYWSSALFASPMTKCWLPSLPKLNHLWDKSTDAVSTQ